jgi:hypothetical protein
MYRYVTVLESHEVKSSQIMSYRGATAGVLRAPHCSSKKAPGRTAFNQLHLTRGRRSDASDTPSLKLHSFVPSGNVVSPSRRPTPVLGNWRKAGGGSRCGFSR